MGWLKRFFYSDDPIVKLAGALTELEAQMRKELLEREGVPAMVKKRGAGLYAIGHRVPFGSALFVKQSDAKRAEDLLGPLMDTAQAKDGPSERPGGQAAG